MLKPIFLLTALALTSCEETRKHRVDPFAALDKHLTHTLAYHYLWPWNQLLRAAAILDAEDGLEEPQIVSTPDKFEINMLIRRFQPDEIRVKVKNRYIIVEGKHKQANEDNKFMANHFVQRFVLPPGSKQEEVTAVITEKGVLTVSVPKRELPPPPPEREVPIEVRIPEKKVEVTTNKVQEETTTPQQLELVETTTYASKIRKKDLKTTTKTAKDNEVTKGVDGNNLDYALVEVEE